jgi:cell division initiation protein
MPTRPFTPEDLASLRFGRRMRGYDRRQVDLLLHELATRHADLARERDDLRERLEAVEQELVEYRDLKARVSDSLIRAEQVAEEVQADANQNAEQILREARERAAHEREQARDEAAATVAAARAEAARLGREIQRLETVRAEMHAGYRAFLLSALELLDEHDEQPGAEGAHVEPLDQTR